jgi:antitoxin YefM
MADTTLPPVHPGEVLLEEFLETAHLLRSPKNARRLASALESALGSAPTSESLEELRRSLGVEEEED